jgi:predicted ester cyclase
MSNTEDAKDAIAYPPAGPSAVDTLGFDRGTGTGEPTSQVERHLRLMKSADDGFNAQDFSFFMDHRHHPDVVVHQFGSPDTKGVDPHRQIAEYMLATFPDLRVHNDPYDIQFGQGEYSVAMGKLSGTFTAPMTLPDGTVVPATGKSFTTFFTTIARWRDDQMIEEWVLYDMPDVMMQIGVAP